MLNLPFLRPPSPATDPLHFSEISPEGQVRLLDMSYGRIVYGVTVTPLVGTLFSLWMHFHGVNVRGLALWSMTFALAALAIRMQRRGYARERSAKNAKILIGRWLPILHRLAWAYGLGLGAGVPLLGVAAAPYDFSLLFLATITAIMAGNATHQSPVLSAYLRFLGCSWSVIMLSIPWVFPDHWTLILPLSALFVANLHKHGVIVHRFFLQQVKLEESSNQLAEQYRTAKNDAEAALLAKNQFLATASHDLRQPVHAMGFLIEAIASRNHDEALLPTIADLRQSVRSVTRMFNSLLDLSKIESGAVQPKPENLRVDDLINDVATLFREEARSRNLELRVRGTGGRAVVHGDSLLMRLCLINLTHNALRYTQRGAILLAARRRGAHWQLEVWDTGVGVALEDQAHIYSPYYRPAHAWRIDNAGHGLGLAVVARCAQMMGADYGMNSRPGRGSCFWLRLLAADGLQPDWPSSEGASSETSFRGHLLRGSCLVVDDDPQVRAAWDSLLASWGLTVRCAASAEEAFEILELGFRPDAIFCDQRLRAGESGFDVLRGLLEKCPHAAGAMISGEFDSPELAQAEREGYLTLSKPLEPDHLYALLSFWLPPADQRQAFDRAAERS